MGQRRGTVLLIKQSIISHRQARILMPLTWEEKWKLSPTF